MFRWWREQPFLVTKMGQLWRLARESHAAPIAGSPRRPELVGPGELGVTFIGHSSFLVQVSGRNLLIDPVFSKRLILLRRQRYAGLLVEELPPIDAVLLTHAHMDHLDLSSLRRVVRATRRLTGKAPEVVVPQGVEDLVAKLGFAKVHEMEWWKRAEVTGLRVTMTPCRHWGGEAVQ